MSNNDFDEQFLKLFKYIQEFRADMDDMRSNMATKDDINDLRNAIDGNFGRVEDVETDNVARDAQFGRLVDWARPVGEKVDIPLTNL